MSPSRNPHPPPADEPEAAPASVLRLVQRAGPATAANRNTVDLAARLLAAASSGQVRGVALVAMLRDGSYSTRITGACADNPTLARGQLRALDDDLRELL